MTTPHRITAEWTGETVAVFAPGPSLTEAVVKALKKHRRIVINHAHRLAPDADMLVALDRNWPDEYRTISGLRITGVADESLDALYIGPQWEAVELSPLETVFITNSGLTAIRIAANMGASKIIMVGFDYPHKTNHFYDDVDETYMGLDEGITALIADLSSKGVTVERYEAK